MEFLNHIEARGGTEMAHPLDAATTELLRDGGASRDRILVLVTDGQVGNEDQLLRTLAPRLKSIRVFTLGVDKAVNAAFLKRLSDLGGGHSELVESEERLDDVMDRVHRHIGTPVLTGLRLEPAGLSFTPGSLTPSRLPDLFAGTPLTILGRYRGKPTGGVALQARDASGGMWSTEVVARRDPSPVASVVWARGRLRDLEDRYVIGSSDRAPLEKEITDLSLRFGVLCRFTAFVAVDRSEVVNAGGQVHSVVQPVEQPAGWEGQRTLAIHGLAPHRIRAAQVPMAAAPPPTANSSGSAEYEIHALEEDFEEEDTGSGVYLEDGPDEGEASSVIASPSAADPPGRCRVILQGKALVCCNGCSTCSAASRTKRSRPRRPTASRPVSDWPTPSRRSAGTRRPTRHRVSASCER